MPALRVIVRTIDAPEQEFTHDGGPFEIGRGRERDLPRFVVADPTVSRDHLRMALQPGGMILVENISSSSEVVTDRGPAIPCGEEQSLPLPLVIAVGNTDLAISVVPSGGLTPERVIGGIDTVRGRIDAPAVSEPATPPPAVPAAPAAEAPPPAAATAPEPSIREVTLLFLAFPAFDDLAGRLDPGRAFAMLSDVLDLANGCIEETDGTVVEHAGSSLLAMWNAPQDGGEHPWKACIAAQRIVSGVMAMSQRWEAETGVTIAAHAAVTTEERAVGPVGGGRSSAYGPIAGAGSLRAQAKAAGALGAGIIISQATRKRLPADLALRRLGPVRFSGDAPAGDLFELLPAPASLDWATRRDNFERALRLVEEGQVDDAARDLADLVATGSQTDVPTLRLLVHALSGSTGPFTIDLTR